MVCDLPIHVEGRESRQAKGEAHYTLSRTVRHYRWHQCIFPKSVPSFRSAS